MTWRLPSTRSFDTSLRSFETPGSVTVTVRPGPVTAVAAAEKFAPSRLPSSCLAALVTLEATASFGVDLARPTHRGGRSRRWWSASADRTLPASTCWRLPHTGRGGLGLCDRERRTPSRSPARRSTCQLAVASRLRRLAADRVRLRRRRIAGVEMVGQQRAQQRRHGDQRRRARLVRIASGIGVVTAEQAHRCPGWSTTRSVPTPSASAASPSPPGSRYSTADHRYSASPQITNAQPHARIDAAPQRVPLPEQDQREAPTSARRSPPCRCR